MDKSDDFSSLSMILFRLLYFLLTKGSSVLQDTLSMLCAAQNADQDGQCRAKSEQYE